VVGLSESGWLASPKDEHRLATGRGDRLHYETAGRCAVWIKRLAHLGAAWRCRCMRINDLRAQLRSFGAACCGTQYVWIPEA